MNTCLINTLTGGSRKSSAVEIGVEQHRADCAKRMKAREDKTRRLALIANGKHPDYQNG